MPPRGTALNSKGDEDLAKYVDLAGKLGLLDALIISPEDMCFDIKSLLKCRWGCDDCYLHRPGQVERGLTYEERLAAIKAYKRVLLVHAHDKRLLNKAVLEIERTAFLDGHYFAFALCHCGLCLECAALKGEACPQPEKVRPCEQAFGLDVYQTARRLGLPCQVLQTKDDVPDRYGFVLID